MEMFQAYFRLFIVFLLAAYNFYLLNLTELSLVIPFFTFFKPTFPSKHLISYHGNITSWTTKCVFELDNCLTVILAYNIQSLICDFYSVSIFNSHPFYHINGSLSGLICCSKTNLQIENLLPVNKCSNTNIHRLKSSDVTLSNFITALLPSSSCIVLTLYIQLRNIISPEVISNELFLKSMGSRWDGIFISCLTYELFSRFLLCTTPPTHRCTYNFNKFYEHKNCEFNNFKSFEPDFDNFYNLPFFIPLISLACENNYVSSNNIAPRTCSCFQSVLPHLCGILVCFNQNILLIDATRKVHLECPSIDLSLIGCIVVISQFNLINNGQFLIISCIPLHVRKIHKFFNNPYFSTNISSLSNSLLLSNNYYQYTLTKNSYNSTLLVKNNYDLFFSPLKLTPGRDCFTCEALIFVLLNGFNYHRIVTITFDGCAYNLFSFLTVGCLYLFTQLKYLMYIEVLNEIPPPISLEWTDLLESHTIFSINLKLPGIFNTISSTDTVFLKGTTILLSFYYLEYIWFKDWFKSNIHVVQTPKLLSSSFYFKSISSCASASCVKHSSVGTISNRIYSFIACVADLKFNGSKLIIQIMDPYYMSDYTASYPTISFSHSNELNLNDVDFFALCSTRFQINSLLPYTFILINNVQTGLGDDLNLNILSNTQSYINVLTQNFMPRYPLPKLTSLILASEFLPSNLVCDDITLVNSSKYVIEMINEVLDDPFSLDFRLHIFRLYVIEINYFSIYYRCSNCSTKQFRMKAEIFNYDILPGQINDLNADFKCTSCKLSSPYAELEVGCTMICKMSDNSNSCFFDLLNDVALKLLSYSNKQWSSITSVLDETGEIIFNQKSIEEFSWLDDMFKYYRYFEVAAQRCYLKERIIIKDGNIHIKETYNRFKILDIKELNNPRAEAYELLNRLT